MLILTQLVYSGIALGMIYAVIAFGYQLTFQTSDTLNFGQGAALMLGAMVGLTLVNKGVNYWLMIPIVCIFGALQGALVERIGVRPAIKIKSEFGWIMSTIALGIIFVNVAENIWGRDDLKFPSPLARSADQAVRREHPADGNPGRLRRRRDDAGGGAVQSQVDLRQGRRRHLQRPRRGQADGHQHRPGHHLLLRAVVDERRVRRRADRAASP